MRVLERHAPVAAADMLRSILTFLLAPLAAAQAFEVVRNDTSTGSCSMPAATRGSDRFYEVEARNVDGRVGERQTLLGLFPIHKQDCKRLVSAKSYNGFQRAEAMSFALDLVNAQVRRGLRRVALDARLLDSCSSGVAAIEAGLEAIWDAAPVAGMVGASYSSVSLAVSPVLQAYQVTMLSYASTAIKLSDKRNYPLFGRLVPSDVEQARVVYDLAVRLEWTTVELLTMANSDYSKSLRDEFLRIVEEDGEKIFVCQDSDNDLKHGDMEKTREVMKRLMSSNSDGVIFFVTADSRMEIIEAVGDEVRRMEHQIAVAEEEEMEEEQEDGVGIDTSVVVPMRFIATDGWDVGDIGDESAARFLHQNSYVVIPDASGSGGGLLHHGENITEHFEKINPANSTNPWIHEVWQELFNCTIATDPTCSQNNLLRHPDFQLDTKLGFVVDSVLLFSSALDSLFADREAGIASHMTEDRGKSPVNSYRFFWDYVMKAEVNDSGRHVKLDCHGNRVGYYGVYRLEHSRSYRGGGGGYKKIGSWSEQRGEGRELEVHLTQTSISFPKNEKIVEEANAIDSGGLGSCRPQCQPGWYEDFTDKNSKCCYKCDRLDSREYKKGFGNPKECPLGQWPDEGSNYTRCRALPVETLDPSSPWSAFALTMAWLGMIIGAGFLIFSLKHYDHVVMRTSHRELSAFTWGGIMVCHLNVLLVFHAEPSGAMCGLIRFTMTTGYTLILSSLYLKTHRLFRIFYAQFKSASGVLGRPRYTSPNSQILFCLGLVSLQCLVVLTWMGADAPRPILVYPAARHVRICKLTPVHLLYAQSFNIILCIITTAYSILNRRLPANYNESRFINLSMYSVCVAWLVDGIGWIFREDLRDEESALLYNPERSWAISTSAKSIMATLVLIFLFTHRVYKILWEKNIDAEKEDEDGPDIIKEGEEGEGERDKSLAAESAM